MTVPITPTLHSIAIFVHDIPRAVEFYRDKLGLPLTKQGSFGAEFLEGETHVSVHPAVHKDAKSLVGRHTGITLFVPDLLHYLRRATRPRRAVHYRAHPAIVGHHGDDRGSRWKRAGALGGQDAAPPRSHQQPVDQADGMAMIAAGALPETVFHHLGLLLHSVRSERLARLHPIGVRTGADPERSVDQIAQLGDHARERSTPLVPRPDTAPQWVSSCASTPRSPVASVRQKHVIAQGHGAIAAGKEHQLAHPTGRATAGRAVQPHA